MENQIKEVNEQFQEFLQTKGIKAKFKLAFENMKENTKSQHEQDVKQFNEIKQKSIEENKDFVEFLHTKGIKAKINLVIENIKKGAIEANDNTKEQIENRHYQNVKEALEDAPGVQIREYGMPGYVTSNKVIINGSPRRKNTWKMVEQAKKNLKR